MSEQAIFVDRHHTGCVKWDMLGSACGSSFGGPSGTCVRINLAAGSEIVAQCADRILTALAQTAAD